ncbi:Btz domain [Trinorchestia longiramus]|nr:Btz domain [Trinorchestia longiramus]
MADRRRRRKPVADGGSDDSSEESADEIINNTLSDLGSDAEGANSEYESADEEDLLPLPAVDPNNPDAKLDDDEDRKNPQYIPKKGTFYEHDDRTMPPDEEGNMLRSDLGDSTAPKNYPGSSLPVVAISDKARADDVASADQTTRLKKSWRGEDGKWSHDKFQEMEQAPKPREELMSVYGYDIRCEEGAPRARRRRRYGRGPNKYTRNWEDLDAYSRPARGGGPRGGRGGKQGPPHPDHKDIDFPTLEEGGGSGNSSRRTGSKPVSESNASNQQENLNQGTSPIDQQEHQPQQQQQQQPPPHNMHTYSNQEYRRSRPSEEHGGEDRGGRGRGRGGRGGRGRGRGGRTERGGWKGKYPGEDGYAQHESPRGSDDVRLSGGRSDGVLLQQHHHQPHQQQQQHNQQHGKHQQLSPRSAPHRNSSEASAHDSPRHGRGDQAHASHSGSRSQYGSGPQHQSGYAHQQQPHQQHQPQQQYGRGNQKRYSSQRGARPGPGSNNMAGGERSGTGGSSNPHYTPHPHHNYYSTTPPPPGPSDRHGPGLVVSGGSSGGPVMYDSSSGNTTVAPHHVPPVTVAIPGASSQFVAPPPPSFVRDPSGCIGGGGAIVAATVAAPTPVIPRMFTPVSVVGATSAELVAPELDHAAIAAALIAGAPVVTADPQSAVVARAPFIASDPSRIPCQFTAAPQATAQQFPAPPAAQFPSYQSYPPPPPPSSEGTQPQEVYRNGVMYYNTQSQQPLRSTTALQKRPKAAIPIVPPPDQLPGEKNEGSTPTPEDADRYQMTEIHNSAEESLYDMGVNESSEERQRTTVVAVERRDSASGTNSVPDFAYDGCTETDPEVVAVVDPSDHYAIQQLQLQQQLQVEEDSNQPGEKGKESLGVSLPSENFSSDKPATLADTNNTDSSGAETIVVPSDIACDDRILNEKTKALSVEDTIEIDGSKFEDSVEQLEYSSSVLSSKLSESVACEKVSENEEKEASIS